MFENLRCSKLSGCGNFKEEPRLHVVQKKLVIRTYRTFEFCHCHNLQEYTGKPAFFLTITTNEKANEFYSLYYTERLSMEFLETSLADNIYSIVNCKGVTYFDNIPTVKQMLKNGAPFSYTIRKCNPGFDKKVEEDTVYHRYAFVFV